MKISITRMCVGDSSGIAYNRMFRKLKHWTPGSDKYITLLDCPKLLYVFRISAQILNYLLQWTYWVSKHTLVYADPFHALWSNFIIVHIFLHAGAYIHFRHSKFFGAQRTCVSVFCCCCCRFIFRLSDGYSGEPYVFFGVESL